MFELVPIAVTLFRLVVLAVVAALVIVVIWAVVRTAARSHRRREGPVWDDRRGSRGQVIDVAAQPPADELTKMIEENNRLLREVLEELRRRPPEPPAPSGHLG
jgi:flagellar biosynthesis/type III secretory pathway M-ring protein FliF/YscJ